MTRIINKDEIYIGNMKSGMKNGNGTLNTTSGSYVGTFASDKKQGNGKLSFFKNNTVLSGYWNEDKFWQTKNWFDVYQALEKVPTVKNT